VTEAPIRGSTHPAHWKHAGALLALCLAAFLPGVKEIPPVDRDEPRYAEATRELLESRDFVRITYRHQPFNHKPIGVHWLQALSVSLVGEHGDNPIWSYRLPSIIGAIAAVLATFAIGRFMFGDRTAAVGAALLALALLVGVEARLATTDASLLACVVVAQASLARIFLRAPGARAGPPKAAWLFWTALGAGILLKGPVIVMVCGLTTLALMRARPDARWLRPLVNRRSIGLALLITLPWLIAITIATSGRFFLEAVRDDMVPTLMSGFEGHGALPGYHALLFPLMFWPGSLLALSAIPWVWRHRHDDRVRFCLAWIVPPWLMFEVIPTKLPHYVLPTYPAIALLAAAALAGSSASLRSVGAKAALALWTVVTIGMSAGILALSVIIDGRPRPIAVLTATLILVFALIVAWLFPLGTYWSVSAGGTLAIYFSIFQLLLPSSEALWLGWSAARAIREQAGQLNIRAPVVATAGFREPSLVFLLGASTVLTDGRGAAEHLVRHASDLALVDAGQREAFRASLAAEGLKGRPLRDIAGINYSTHKRQTLELYARD
jgi:4-amino-4-deoxy-L-arabinose transferase-like glycosyltransferase